jgi:hypothetical protein
MSENKNTGKPEHSQRNEVACNDLLAKQNGEGYDIFKGDEKVATLTRSARIKFIWHLRDHPHKKLIDWDRYQNDIRARNNILS